MTIKNWRIVMLPLLIVCGVISCNQSDTSPGNPSAGSHEAPSPTGQVPIITKRLGSYNVDLSQSSVSGLSAGAYMAGQFFVAFSDDVLGAGLFAGGPYGCSRGNLLSAMGPCMRNIPSMTRSDIDRLYNMAKENAAAGRIDPLENLVDRSVYIFSGKNDDTVKPGVSDWIDDWFEKAGMPVSNILYENNVPAGHALPTLDYLNSCVSKNAPPWMSDCDYDGAGAVLQHIYGHLKPKTIVTGTSGSFIRFPQNEFFMPGNLTKVQLQKRYSFNEFGYAYVPKVCEQGEPCRIHIVFHGCRQIYDRNPRAPVTRPDDDDDPFGLQMVKKAGFNEWANTNHLIILYPQAQKTGRTQHIRWTGNPNGCFDWWGYIKGTTKTYATRKAPQMAAVHGMLVRLAGAPSVEDDDAGQANRPMPPEPLE